MIGTTIGPYRVLDKLGAGGMGEVYRARDARLDRTVAIKILPDAFAKDPERLARFEREAKTLASLNHPHIAQIYGLEVGVAQAFRPANTEVAQGSGVAQGFSPALTALIMELVEGEDLAERIARGPVPSGDALPIALQIAEALEAAHERGIIHRDLKPANIKVAPDGSVKVLDFGLAKALAPEGASATADLMNSPTVTSPATQLGMILGTAAYMAPEQARGQSVDRRADIWAFGVVLFEMLSGKRAFSGDTISDVLASVLKNDIDWRALPADLPPAIRTLLARCLTPDRKNRLRDIGEARIAMAGFMSSPETPVAPARPVAAGSLRMWQVASAVLALVAVAALGIATRDRAPASSAPVRYTVAPPDGVSVYMTDRPAVAISPDGGHLAFVGVENGTTRLYLRRQGDFDARVMPGTDSASNPVFSPDGRTIAFFAADRLKTISLEGSVASLAPVNDPRGLAWVDATTLVYTPESIGGLSEISLHGDPPRALSTIDEKGGERTHRWPHVLPGGKWVLFTVGTTASPDHYDDSRIDAVNRATGERRSVVRKAAMARYAPTGHLLLSRGGSVLAVAFDPAALKTSGEPVNVLQDLGRDAATGAMHVAWSGDGTLVYAPADTRSALRQIVWADAKGAHESVAKLAPGLYSDARLSPDGTRMAMRIVEAMQADIWVFTFARGSMTRLTFGGLNVTPQWSKDGRDVYYASISPSGRETTILRANADGGRDPIAIMSIAVNLSLKHVSADGSWAVVDYVVFGGPDANVGRLPLRRGAEIEPLVTTRSDDYASAMSPNGRFVAYQSDESTRPEIYVRELAASGGRWQVSSAGGEEPMWSRDGRTLYFRYGTQLFSVDVDTSAAFRSGIPTAMFDGIYNHRSDTGVSYEPRPDGGRFLMLRQAESASRGSVRVATGWFEELTGKVQR